MTYAQAIAYIQQWIIDNNNKEITASIMRDVLEKMLLYVRGEVGDARQLQQGNDVVEAVNILFGMFNDLEVNFPIEVHTGTDNPNITPPASFQAPDFYIRNGVQTYIYTGSSWVLIQDSSAGATPSLELVAQSGNTTSVKLIGTDYFANKSDNDFAQMADIQNAISGVNYFGSFDSVDDIELINGNIGDFATLNFGVEQYLYQLTDAGWRAVNGLFVQGLKVKKRPSNLDYSIIQTYDFCEGWVNANLFVNGLWKGGDDPTLLQLQDKNNWSEFIEIE